MLRQGKALGWAWQPCRRPKFADDPLFEDGTIYCWQEFKQIPIEYDEAEDEEDSLDQSESFSCQIGHCDKAFHRIIDYEMHYNTAHRNVCDHCHRSFPTGHLLDIHILEWHDTLFQMLAAKQDMFQCLVSNCAQKFANSDSRRRHLVKDHKYPASFRFDRRKGKSKPKQKGAAAGQTASGSSCSQMDVENSTDVPQCSSKTQSEDMETAPTVSPRTFSPRVPKNISFGKGVSRGFHRPRGRGRGRGGKKHWHQPEQQMDTTVNIEKVQMSDLGDVLDNMS